MTTQITKADRRTILRALAAEARRLERKPTEKQFNTPGFLSVRAMESAEIVHAYEHIKAIDPDTLPARLEEEAGA